MRYSVFLFVLVNVIIRDSATTRKAATTSEPVKIKTTSLTTAAETTTAAATTSEPVTITTTSSTAAAAAAAAAAATTTTTSAQDSTSTSELTSSTASSTTETTEASTKESETTDKATTTLGQTTTPETTATTSGTKTTTTTTKEATTDKDTVSTEATEITSDTSSKITEVSTTVDPTTTTTNESSTKPVSTTNQTTPKVTETTTLQPNTTTSNSRNTTETTTNTDQPGSYSTTVSVFNETTTTEINTTDSRDTTISSSDSSTSIATSTKQPGTTTKYPGETKYLSSLRINIDLQISLSNATYNESLADRSSDIYIAYERSIRTKLYETYKDITGFNHVVINNFRNGSVVCNYTVVVNADSNITIIAERIAEATETLNFTNSSLKIFDEHFKMYVDEKIVNASIQNVLNEYKVGGICNLIDRACETFEYCLLNIPDKIRCTHKCYSGENVCQNGGSCFYDVRKETMDCKCTKDNDFIYYGPNCVQKAEKFALNKNDIIGLSAGCGGGVFVILLVVIIVLLKKKTRKGKESDQKLDLSREVSIEDIRLHRLNESHSSNGFQNRFEPRAKPNQYETRMPETKFLHGRAHDIYKDSAGEETYIYPSPSYIHPISASGHRDSTKSGQSMYDYIDTESRFEIQRPRIRLGQSSAF